MWRTNEQSEKETESKKKGKNRLNHIMYYYLSVGMENVRKYNYVF